MTGGTGVSGGERGRWVAGLVWACWAGSDPGRPSGCWVSFYLF
jgi:hypothetical protein